jgi:hypothetical protein
MTRTKWLKYIEQLDRLHKRGLMTRYTMMKTIDHLIDEEQKEWDARKDWVAGLKKRPGRRDGEDSGKVFRLDGSWISPKEPDIEK